jgi:hypothetical protein
MAAIDDLIKQIQSRSNTSQWSGGYGADAATKDMARILSSIGITNIKDFGKIDKYEPVQVVGHTLDGKQISRQESRQGVVNYYEMIPEPDGEGGISGYQKRTLTPEEITKVKPVYASAVDHGVYDQAGDPVFTPVDTSTVVEKEGKLVGVTGQTFGNKLTGQEVPNTYTTRQTGDFFGGTYEGKGNTGYGVQFDAQGLPVFYTQGASSKDDIITDLMPMVQLALMATGAGGLLGNALLGAGASQVAAGALGGALLGGGTAAIAGQDVLKGALLGGAGGALSGYLNPATGQVSATPTEGSIPVSGDDIAKLSTSSSDLYSLASPTAKSVDGLRAGTAANVAEMGGAQGFKFNVGAPVTNVADAVRAIATMSGSVNPANLSSMGGGQGLTYQTPTGLVTQGGTLNVGGLTGNNSVISQGGIDTATNIGSDITKRVAAIDTGVDGIKLPATPVDAKTAAKTGLTASDAIRAAGVAATIAGLNQAVGGGGGSGGFPIVPIPSDWTSPIKPTATAAFTPLAPIDFGNKEMLRGTQWEQLLSPDYGKAPAMPTSTNPSNMTFNELTKILGGSRESIPTQNLSINDVIAGIQSQYGQTPQGSMG